MRWRRRYALPCGVAAAAAAPWPAPHLTKIAFKKNIAGESPWPEDSQQWTSRKIHAHTKLKHETKARPLKYD
jgi:hypothetical protein